MNPNASTPKLKVQKHTTFLSLLHDITLAETNTKFDIRLCFRGYKHGVQSETLFLGGNKHRVQSETLF